MSGEPATILSRSGVAALAGHLPTPEGTAGEVVNAPRFLAVDAVAVNR